MGVSSDSRPSHVMPSKIACTASGVERSRSVSSIRSRNVPPVWRAYSQLKSAVRAVPMCIIPGGEGAIRVTTGTAGSGIALPGERARALSTRLRRLPSAGALARGAASEAIAQLDRGFLWVPVAFGLGAALYLGLKSEPALWPAASAATALGLGAGVNAWRGGGRALTAALLMVATVAAGFSVAKLRSDHVAAPIVPSGLGVAAIEGYVVDVDTPSASGPRLLLAPTFVSPLTSEQLPARTPTV